MPIAKTAMMAITTSSSVRVKPALRETIEREMCMKILAKNFSTDYTLFRIFIQCFTGYPYFL
jgi:hypothetical protein